MQPHQELVRRHHSVAAGDGRRRPPRSLELWPPRPRRARDDNPPRAAELSGASPSAKTRRRLRLGVAAAAGFLPPPVLAISLRLKLLWKTEKSGGRCGRLWGWVSLRRGYLYTAVGSPFPAVASPSHRLEDQDEAIQQCRALQLWRKDCTGGTEIVGIFHRTVTPRADAWPRSTWAHVVPPPGGMRVQTRPRGLLSVPWIRGYPGPSAAAQSSKGAWARSRGDKGGSPSGGLRPKEGPEESPLERGSTPTTAPLQRSRPPEGDTPCADDATSSAHKDRRAAGSQGAFTKGFLSRV